MRRFVQPRRRTLSRRIIVRTESKKTSSSLLFLYYHWQKIVGSIVTIAIIFFLFFYNWSPIQRVTFTQNTFDTLSYDPIYTSISQELVWKWYFKQKYRNLWDMIATIRKQFPIVKNIRPVSFAEWTLTVETQYNNPDFVATTSDGVSWIVYRNNFVPITEWTTLWLSWLSVGLTITNDMLQNVSGGVFWKMWSQDLVKVINQLTFLPEWSRTYTYYPGWEKLQVVANNGTFIFALDQAKLQQTFEAWKNLIPYMPTADPYSADLSNPERIIIKQ